MTETDASVPERRRRRKCLKLPPHVTRSKLKVLIEQESPDKIRLFHLTSAEYLVSIRKQGLLSNPPNRNYDYTPKSSRALSVYFSANEEHIWKPIIRKSPTPGPFKPTLANVKLSIEIPIIHIENLHDDEALGNGYFRFEGDIPRSWIRIPKECKIPPISTAAMGPIRTKADQQLSNLQNKMRREKSFNSKED